MQTWNKNAFHSLFQASHTLTLIMLMLIPVQILIFVLAPPPSGVANFFSLFQQNPFLGLLSLDFLYLLNNAILIVIYIAVFILLYGEKPVAALLGVVLGLVGIACYYPSNPAFEMLTLSNLHATADPAAQTLYIAAGEAVMAGYTGTSFNSYYVLNSVCLLLFSYAFLTTPGYRKAIGLWGLASGILMIVPSSAGAIGMVFSLLSLIPWMVFIALLLGVFRKEAKMDMAASAREGQ